MLLTTLVWIYLCIDQYTNGIELADGIEFLWESLYPNVVCYTSNLDRYTGSHNPQRISVKELDVVECPLPSKSYAEALTALNVDVTVIERLGVVDAVMGPKFRSFTDMHFQGFPNLRNLTFVSTWHTRKFKVTSLSLDYLNTLSNLTELYTIYMDNFPLPKTNRLKKLYIEGGTLPNELGGCSELEEFTIESVNATGLNNWIASCPRLTKFSILGVTLTEEKLQEILLGAKQLTTLTVRACQLKSIGCLNSNHLVNLTHVDLSANLFTAVSLNYWPKLQEIIMQYSDLNRESVHSILQEHKNLLNLDFTGSNKLDICGNITSRQENIEKIKHSKLQRLMLESTEHRALCFDQLEVLEFLSIQLWSSVLQFSGLPVSSAPRMIVDLSWISEEKIVHLSEEDYKMLRNESYYFEKINKTTPFTRGAIEIHSFDISLECDCAHGWFARALRDEPRLSFTGKILCKDKNDTELQQAPANWMECDKWSCDGTCTCRRYWSENATEIDCHQGRLEKIPRIVGLRTLVAPNNDVNFISADDLPETLKVLDLSNNRLSLMKLSTSRAIFNVSDRRVRLAGNPIVCNCDNQEFIEMLQYHRGQVEDYEKIKCAEDGRPVSEVELAGMCKSGSRLYITAGIGVTCALIALSALAGAIYYRYHREIRVLLYSYGCCLWCVHEEELDADRPYDAFVSFSHGDEQYVMEELVPGLERAPHSYRVCVHYRDWVPGEFIPLQISRSVEQSRRTIIVMSKNYTASMWGLLEFQTAHNDTLQSRRPRIIVILLEEIKDDSSMDDQIRTYLKNNTFVKRKDPWFWEKLFYAMPHRNLPREDNEQSRIIPLPLVKNKN